MLPKINRLKSREDFDRVRKSGKMIQEKNFGMVVSPTDVNTKSRFGFIVSKKISNKAVTRNKLKRVFREALRERIEKISNGHDVVFLVKRSALNSKREEISKEIEKSLKKGNLI